MPKIYTTIGYAPRYKETAPGVWEENVVEKNYYGEIIRNTRRLENQGQVNDSVNINNRISIVADPYARENYHTMRWIMFMGSKWKIVEVEVEYPRLILTLGGLFNENEDENGASGSS